MRAIRIRETGWLSSIQDQGRPGYGHLGVPPSGAIDPELAARINRLVGNSEDSAVIETAGQLVIEARSDLLVASSDTGALQSLRTGDLYRVNRMPDRNFAYLGIRGGVQTSQALGSSSQDSLSGIGPGSLQPGSLWEVGPEPSTAILIDQIAIGPLPSHARIWPGPHLHLFAEGTFDMILRNRWINSGVMDRIGLRLEGPLLTQRIAGDIPSEPLLTGAIQIPPDGQPILMLRDHPTTGGYPVVAVVDPQDLYLIAQTPPGGSLWMLAGSQDQTTGRATATVDERRR